MTKKKINIGLILVVLGLWGAVGYRFIKNNYPQHDIAGVNHRSNKISQKLIVERDTFLLEPLVRDPFLDRKNMDENSAKSINPQRSFSKVKTNKTPKAPKVIVNKYWPDIQYYGYIKSNQNNEVVLIKIDGQLLRMHKNEKKNDLVIKDIYKDSVAILFNKEKRTFRHFRNQVTTQ